MNRFQHALCLSIIALVLSGAAYARDKDGNYTVIGNKSCGYYLDGYSKATLTDTGFKGVFESSLVFGFISGYLTAYNTTVPNGKQNILGSMSINDARRWIASWCWDNPSKDMDDGTQALIVKLVESSK